MRPEQPGANRPHQEVEDRPPLCSQTLADGEHTVGVLVLSNFGKMPELRFGSVPFGRIIAPQFESHDRRRSSSGSIITVVATDAPLASNQLTRLAKRAALGIGRAGSSAAGGAGRRVSTRQNPQARVHRSPSTMNVAVRSFQHSLRFGQPASSHTVTSPWPRTVCFRASTSRSCTT